MRKQLVYSFIPSLCFFFLASCAPSPEVIGTQTSVSSSSTAAAWTPTLTPTKTRTQNPTIKPTITSLPTITPSPTVTPQGGSSQLLIAGRLGSYKGVPSIYLYDSKTGNSNVLFENYNLASISPDEKHLTIYVSDWKASFQGPVVGELYLSTLNGFDPVLISSDFLTNSGTKWTDSDTFTYSEMKNGIFNYYEYTLSSASINELPAPTRSNDNFDSITGMFKTYPAGECQTYHVGTMYDWNRIVDCASQNGQYIWREQSSSKPTSDLNPSILRIDGSIVKELALEDVFPGSDYYHLRGFWSPNSQFLLVLGDTYSQRELGILTIADLSIKNVDLSEILPEWPRNVQFSEESISPDGDQLLLWHNGSGPSIWSTSHTTLILELPSNTVRTIELGLPENTYLDRIIWLHK